MAKAENSKKRKHQKSLQEDYSLMDKNELISEIERLNKHVIQIKALLKKQQKATSTSISKGSSKQQRAFDISKYNKRHILLKFAYLGWNYKGFITQEDTSDTVEDHLFEALMTTRLIENRQTSNYHRCGRTDKGVSAFCQVISIDCRSNCADGTGVIKNPNSTITNTDIKKEFNYIKLLNAVLPDEIRILAWCPVKEDMSSRFDCDGRSYRYFFPKGDLDIDFMRKASQKLVGDHDYRNFCKMDVGNGVVTFGRRIDSISIQILEKDPTIYSTVEVIITGSSFLWHQIRAIMAIIFLVGQKKESPEIVDELLDVTRWPCKPLYTIASELPLVLFDSHYKDVEWICEKDDLEKVIKHLQDIWLSHSMKATVLKRMIDHLEIYNDTKQCAEDTKTNEKHDNVRKIDQPYAFLQGKTNCLNYVKLENRETAKSLENRVEHFIKRKRIDRDLVTEKMIVSETFSKK